jgi:hypothetical protein
LRRKTMEVVSIETALQEPFTPCTDEELAQDEARWRESVFRGMPEYLEFWQKQGFKVFAWVDDVPDYFLSTDFDEMIHGLYERQDAAKAPFKVEFRLALIGGGQIKVTLSYDWDRWEPGTISMISKDTFVVTVHDDDGVRRFHTGTIDKVCYDLCLSAVLFRSGTPQEVADRVAATFRAIDKTPENFHALLDSSQGCAFCGRALRDEVSKLIGVGPDCAKQNGIPHSMEAASKRLMLRRKLLGEIQ